jgi:hypothetical protein
MSCQWCSKEQLVVVFLLDHTLALDFKFHLCQVTTSKIQNSLALPPAFEFCDLQHNLLVTLGMNTLKELDLSRCKKISDAGIKHIVTIESLEKLHLSETELTDNGVMLISSLTNLSFLDLGGILMTDKTLQSLQVLSLMVCHHFLLLSRCLCRNCQPYIQPNNMCQLISFWLHVPDY